MNTPNFKLCKITGSYNASRTSNNNQKGNYHIQLQNANFFGSKPKADLSLFKFITTENGFRVKESKEFVSLESLLNAPIDFFFPTNR